MAKRLFDFIFAGLALLVLWPLLMLVAIWIKWDSPGPVVFQQTRVGRNGHPFQILKFRTMATVQNPGALQITVGEDPRITRPGKWLRRYKIDELPQLWNVLRGDMSLVGPRPEVPRYVALYTDLERAQVLSVRPGITDDASIEYVHENAILARAPDPEAAYQQVVMPAKMPYYMAYAQQQSFLGDLRIIIKTVLVVFRR